MTIGRTEQQNRRVFAIVLLIVIIFCLPLSYFVLTTPPKNFFLLWLNDDDLIPKVDDSPCNKPNSGSKSFSEQEENEEPPLLLLISYDAFRYDYIEKHLNVTPTFQWLIKNGVYATEGLKNTFITITAPNHYGIVTGLYEENHGIIANSFFDPILNESFNYFDTRWKTDPKFFGGNPIWITNDEASSSRATGCMMWVGCDVPINHKPTPLHWVSWDGNLDWAARIDALISWFKNPKRPINFGLLYIEEPDETGHQYGPDSPELVQMLWKLDQLTESTPFYDNTVSRESRKPGKSGEELCVD
uniref:Bis(5'-adenosyl)-triphosphatase n=1 Tax=Romanomermis culicivorax TaxID=13658 RepID=A0A915IQ98_ROMCU